MSSIKVQNSVHYQECFSRGDFIIVLCFKRRILFLGTTGSIVLFFFEADEPLRSTEEDLVDPRPQISDAGVDAWQPRLVTSPVPRGDAHLPLLLPGVADHHGGSATVAHADVLALDAGSDHPRRDPDAVGIAAVMVVDHGDAHLPQSGRQREADAGVAGGAPFGDHEDLVLLWYRAVGCQGHRLDDVTGKRATYSKLHKTRKNNFRVSQLQNKF